MALIETWIVKNNSYSSISILDIMVSYTVAPNESKDLISIGNTAESIANSPTIRNANLLIVGSGPNAGKRYLDSDYTHLHDDYSETDHTHDGLDVLTGGPLSDADLLHTHDKLTDEIEVNVLINDALTNFDLSDYVTKAGNIDQLSDITSPGADIENAVTKAHDEAHTLLEHLDDDPVTVANLTKLMDGSNADCCHTHSNLGGGTFDGEHNDLDGLQGGILDEYYHLTFDQTDIVSRLGEDSAGLTFDGESIGTGGGGTSIHNDLTGLQGGDVDEYYHATYDEYIGLTGGPSFYADDLHNHNFPTTAYELPLGEACDGDWTDGLFAWDEDTQTSCALDDVNEVLGSLAPAPAPDLDDVSVDNASGVSEDLSFGASQAIAGYTSCTGIGALSPVNINGTFTNSGKREGIINDGVDISGVLASDVPAGDGSPTVAYPAQSFGDADQGILVLELNGVEQTSQNITLTNPAAQDTTSSGTVTGLDVILATSVKFPSGASFDQFKYRTGTYHIESGDMRNGWNYARVIHRVGGSDRDTNYVDWVVDAVNTATSFSLEALDTYSPSASKHLSGVEYDTAATALYDITISNAYLNTYVTSTTAVTFNETALNGVGNESLSGIFVGFEDETKTHVITNKVVTVDTSNRRLINQSVALSTRLNRTVQTDSNSGGDSIPGILFDNFNSSATEAGVEDFIAETYRLNSDTNFTSTASLTTPTNWDETQFIYDAGNTGYDNGLQVTNGILDYPSVDYRNVTIIEGPAGNPNYSGGACTGERYYYRYFKHATVTSPTFRMNFNGSGTFVKEGTLSASTNEIAVSIKLPDGAGVDSGTGWMDCYEDFVTDSWTDGSGCRTTTNGNSGRDFDNWDLDVGTKNTANSGNGVYIRITVPQNWTGSISHLTFNFGFT